MIDIIFTSGITDFLIVFLSLAVAISIHEFAHAYTADRLGDPTPRLQGRVTLNPLKHLDPVGTLLLVFAGIGWGRPVMFDPFNLKDPKRDTALISLAGPASNIILAVIVSIVIRLIDGPFSPFSYLTNPLILIVFYNILLAIFNLIPIHPLDGGKIFIALLPDRDAREADMFLRRYGILILILLILPIFGGRSAIWSFLIPVISFAMKILLPGNALF